MTSTPKKTPQIAPGLLGVAEAKRRFSELIDRVDSGERFVVSRHGRPALVLGPPTPEALKPAAEEPIGLAAVAGALAEWDDLPRSPSRVG
jgi:antitoxin (DNA-binding transcriptional repressor) of toxin-antitoxin stability system